MLVYKTIKTIGSIKSNNFRDTEFEKFEDYREYAKEKTAKINEVIRENLVPNLYDYVFGKTDENPMDSVSI